MILFVKKNCPFCPTDLVEEVEHRGGKVFPVVRHPDGSLFTEVGEQKFSLLPQGIVALPALIMDDHKVIIGRMPIEKILFAKEFALCI